jgi:hypothetical protein
MVIKCSLLPLQALTPILRDLHCNLSNPLIDQGEQTDEKNTRMGQCCLNPELVEGKFIAAVFVSE